MNPLNPLSVSPACGRRIGGAWSPPSKRESRMVVLNPCWTCMRRGDVRAILTPPCVCCMENHEWNIQGGVRMTLLTTRANLHRCRLAGLA